jgi:protein-S-isoprenylcysteine O-methyltransferase Ste14
MNGLFARALIAFIVLPGVVAFLVPLLFASPGTTAFWTRWGLVPVAAGIVLLLACAREFYLGGRGTLAPWAPPTALVVTGPYRWCRNPMYVAVLLILSGWAISFRSWPLALYAVAVLVAFHLRIVLHEEPWLARTFGGTWIQYRRRVSRWLGPAAFRRSRRSLR